MKTPEQYVRDAQDLVGSVDERILVTLAKKAVKTAQAEAYAAGQKRGHEDAARYAGLPCATQKEVGIELCDVIHNLPIQPLPESQPTQDKGDE